MGCQYKVQWLIAPAPLQEHIPYTSASLLACMVSFKACSKLIRSLESPPSDWSR